MTPNFECLKNVYLEYYTCNTITSLRVLSAWKGNVFGGLSMKGPLMADPGLFSKPFIEKLGHLNSD